MSSSATPILPTHNVYNEPDQPSIPRRATTASTITADYALLSPEETARRLNTSLTTGSVETHQKWSKRITT